MKNIDFHKFPKQDPYQAPEGYLEKLPYQIQERVQLERKEGYGWAFKVLPKVQLAYTFLLLLTAGWLYTSRPEAIPPDADTIISQTEEQAIMEYLHQQEEVSVYEIVASAEWEEETVKINALLEEEVAEGEILDNIENYSLEDLAYEE